MIFGETQSHLIRRQHHDVNPKSQVASLKACQPTCSFGCFRTSHRIVILETSTDHRLHFHCIIDRPCHCSFNDFAAVIREQWWKTDFGYHQVDVQDQPNVGWTDYILKQRQKVSLLDSIDWANCQLIAE